MLIPLRIILIFVALVIIGVVTMFVWARTAARPSNLGVTNGQLAPCPETPNCVTTQRGNPDQMMEALTYTTAREEAQARLLEIVRSMPRSQIIANEPGYIAVVFRSPTFGFPDDVEFYLDDEQKLIHFRAAARLGQSDLGVNRKRMEEIRRAFEAGGKGT